MLAQWQTHFVSTLLQTAWPDLQIELVPFTTEGDRVLDRALPEIGGKGVFTQEMERALVEGEIDLAVHSLKDLPVADSENLTVGAICSRGDAHDVLVSAMGCTLEQLPKGARVGTSSVRRAAQLLASRPDLVLLPLRGNVDTRVNKVLHGDYDAIVLAAAGIQRLGLQSHICRSLSFDVMLPAPGQGAVAVQCRVDDDKVRSRLHAIHDPVTCAAVTAERAFLAALGGGCAAPVAAYGEFRAGPVHKQRTDDIADREVPAAGQVLDESNLYIYLRGLVASTNGKQLIRVRGEGMKPIPCGTELAEQALMQGAAALLEGSTHK